MLAWSKVILPLDHMERPLERIVPPRPVKLTSGPAQWRLNGDGTVTVQTGEHLPPVGWAQVLCNENFGWLTDETGAGFLWAGGNSREGKLSPWPNDPLAVGGPERIVLELEGEEISLFADGDGLPCTVTYGPGFARWEKRLGVLRLTTEGFVPRREDCRVLTVNLTGTSGKLTCRMGEGEPVSHPLADGLPLSLIAEPADKGLNYRFSVQNYALAREETLNFWAGQVSAIQVDTPDPDLDHYLNGWCLYQVLACRLMARTSQYQNGGAFGFRDQLQDVAALLYTSPERTRAQLLLAASRQFEEGDVQHWWHPPHGAGVRTRITDDLLFLPWVLAQYCGTTGDWAILEEKALYLTSKPLEPGEMERYEVPQVSEKTDTLYRHALAAIQCVLDRGPGPHGLVRMGGGDWNDGMNRVGARGGASRCGLPGSWRWLCRTLPLSARKWEMRSGQRLC